MYIIYTYVRTCIHIAIHIIANYVKSFKGENFCCFHGFMKTAKALANK